MAETGTGAAVNKLRRGQKSYHPFELFEHKLRDEEWLEEARNWLIAEATDRYKQCVAKNGNRLQCDCFNVLADAETADAVAEYLLFFGKSSAAERDRIVFDMVRWQEHVKPPQPYKSYCHYKLPYVVSPNDDDNQAVKKALKNHFVCLSSIQHLLAFGRKRMSRIRKDINAGLIIPR